MDLLKVWSVSGGLPLRERAKQRQAYRHQELRRWREFLGIPTYVFEGELFWGQDRLQTLEWHLGIECRRRSARRGCARDRVADDRGTDEKNRRLGHRDS
jgi:2-hydroxychromene-2-carboxylate isomerase